MTCHLRFQGLDRSGDLEVAKYAPAVPPKRHIKHLRPLIEIFKFCTFKELSVLCQVNRTYYTVISYDEELWKCIFHLHYSGLPVPVTRYRLKIIYIHKHTCHTCTLYLTTVTYQPYFKKLLCPHCLETAKKLDSQAQPRCHAMTLMGRQCMRPGGLGNYCWQHGPDEDIRNFLPNIVIQTIGRCEATTLAGYQCSRAPRTGESSCWQHSNTYVSNTYVSNTYVSNTYVSNTYVSNTYVSNTYVSNSSGECQSMTLAGAQCSRLAQAGRKYCWQHPRGRTKRKR